MFLLTPGVKSINFAPHQHLAQGHHQYFGVNMKRFRITLMSESQSLEAIQEAYSAPGMGSELAFLLPSTWSRTAATALERA